MRGKGGELTRVFRLQKMGQVFEVYWEVYWEIYLGDFVLRGRAGGGRG